MRLRLEENRFEAKQTKYVYKGQKEDEDRLILLNIQLEDLLDRVSDNYGRIKYASKLDLITIENLEDYIYALRERICLGKFGLTEEELWHDATGSTSESGIFEITGDEKEVYEKDIMGLVIETRSAAKAGNPHDEFDRIQKKTKRGADQTRSLSARRAARDNRRARQIKRQQMAA
ncbi:MAG: hypothetical protein OEY44_04140 [Candidatus Peregrinibacteria bacterium]|nr:hypothetical protein [Candidatus Peregrinibacteria bacterium]